MGLKLILLVLFKKAQALFCHKTTHIIFYFLKSFHSMDSRIISIIISHEIFIAASHAISLLLSLCTCMSNENMKDVGCSARKICGFEIDAILLWFY